MHEGDSGADPENDEAFSIGYWVAIVVLFQFLPNFKCFGKAWRTKPTTQPG